MKAMLGLGTGALSPRALETLAESAELRQLGLPNGLIARMAYVFGEERFDETVQTYLPELLAVLRGQMAAAGDRVAETHSTLVADTLHTGLRREEWAGFLWTVVPAPPGGAILPDVVAIGYRGEACGPLIFAAAAELTGVVFPLSASRLLIGRPPGQDGPDPARFNADAAAASVDFFLAQSADPGFGPLSQRIGEASAGMVEREIAQSAQEVLPPAAPTVRLASPGPVDQALDVAAGEATLPAPRLPAFQFTFIDWPDAESRQRAADTLTYIVLQFSRYSPLDRLDGVTIAADYPAALRDLDHGDPALPVPQTAPVDVGTGIAMSPSVVREGRVMTRVVLDAGVAAALLEDDDATVGWAVHVVARQLAEVAMTELVETALPGFLLSRSEAPIDARLYPTIHGALEGYGASRMAAGWGAAQDVAPMYAALLTQQLDRVAARVVEARLAYRDDADMARLLDVALPEIARLLEFAAQFLGVCDELELAPLDQHPALAETLERRELRSWFRVYRQDLQAYWDRRGAWSDPRELLDLRRHVERLLWQSGILPWPTDDGGLYVHVPLQSDAMALLARLEAAGATAPETPG